MESCEGSACPHMVLLAWEDIKRQSRFLDFHPKPGFEKSLPCKVQMEP